MKPCFPRTVCLIAAVAVLAGCQKRPPAVRETFLAMGTVGSLSLPAGGAQPLNLEQAAALVTNRLEALEARFSVYRPESELSRLNASAAQGAVPVSAEMRAVLHLALRHAEAGGGAFDVTVGPLMRLWGFQGGARLARAPAAEAVQAVLNHVGYRHLVLSNGAVAFDRAGIEVDLGGIVKGYAVDRCCEELQGRGVTHALVNLGGNMRALGDAGGGRPWMIGVRDPFVPGRTLGALPLAAGRAVATSGHYERFVMLDGVLYAHIMDPRTGFPARGMASVTVLAPTAAEADVLSTLLFVQGLPGALATLQARPDCEALLVPDAQPPVLWATPGFAAVFQPEARAAERLRRVTGPPPAAARGR